MKQDLVIHGIYIAFAIGLLMTFGLILTWVERKQAAVMSDRIGANRAYLRIPFTQVKLVWWGLFHGLADGMKMLLKEDFLVDSPELAAWFGDRTYRMQIADLDAGLLVIFAFGGVTVIGSMLAGWSSNNKFSMLGAIRSASQMISYELVMGLTVLGLILIYGTVDLTEIVQQQSGVIAGFLPAWGLFLQPFAAVLFMTAAQAENRRIPFDLPEAESELIAGYFTEYSAMKMGLFMFAEFIEIAIIAALFVTLFLGGYNLPYMSDAGFTLPGGHFIALSHGTVVLLQVLTFLVKVFLMCSFQILVRWSLPRFRYDQLLRFAWKFMLPLAIANLIVTVVAVWAIRGAGA
jgi:NADH-quinone oxidoreductase subunit H